MENLSKKSCPGFSNNWTKIEFIAYEDVQSVDIVDFTTRNISLKQNASFGKIDAKNIVGGTSGDGTSNRTEIDCDFFTTGMTIDSVLNSLKTNVYLVKMKNKSGLWFLFGSIEEPLHFDYDRIGNSADGVSKYSLRFYRNTTLPVFRLV